MMASGTAYPCFSTPAEIEAWRAESPNRMFQSPWRDTAPEDRPDAPYAIRLRAPREGETVIRDQVQGDACAEQGAQGGMGWFLHGFLG